MLLNPLRIPYIYQWKSLPSSPELETGRNRPTNKDVLISKLEHSKLDRFFVSLPDLYLDHLAVFNDQPAKLLAKFVDVIEQGGGNIPLIHQDFCLGGNATNFFLAMSGLGAKASLIARTSDFGLSILKFFTRGYDVDLSHVTIGDQLSVSFILEVRNETSNANIMISDPGGIRDFGFDKLSEEDLQSIRRSDYVCVFNWAQNRKGTDLVAQLFDFVRKLGHKKTFLDLGDPSLRMDEIPKLMKILSEQQLLDILGVNENEVKRICKTVGLQDADDPKNLARLLSEKMGFEIALHTSTFSLSSKSGDTVEAPAFDLKPVRITGAGDAWNAGFLFGDAAGLDRSSKLLFANATAGAHITKSPGSTVMLKDVKTLINDRNLVK